MSDAIIVGIIAAVASIVAAIVTSRATQTKVQNDIVTSDAVQNEKIEQVRREQALLREEVKKHNAFGERIPVLEEKVKVANNRILDLEKKVG